MHTTSLAVLYRERRRCTYAALAGLLGVGNQGVGKYRGHHRPAASWVVRKDKGKPTDYDERDEDKNLLCGLNPLLSRKS